jgi:predicted nucleic acid-binding protein
MRIVVADTSPLNYLIQLDCVDVLRALHGELLIPDAVSAELAHRAAPPEVQRWVASPPPWVQVVSLSETDPSLPALLGAGEREAISLAASSPGCLLIVDDQRARLAATQRGIETTGTLAIIRNAALRGSLSFPATILKLVELGFRLSPGLQAEILARYEQESQGRSQ